MFENLINLRKNSQLCKYYNQELTLLSKEISHVIHENINLSNPILHELAIRLFSLNLLDSKDLLALWETNKSNLINFLKNNNHDVGNLVSLNSNSQFGQDIVALIIGSYSDKPFFVEFGATNGVDSSNTFLLEKFHNWSGILNEPAPIWKEQLKINRRCSLDFKAIWHEDDIEIEFLQTELPELSTAAEFSIGDLHSKRRSGLNMRIETISLKKLLKEYKAPNYIDFLSVDTEGSELDILKDFDFKEFSFGFIAVEHNFSSNRYKLDELILKHGYTKILTGFSNVDNWYILNELIKDNPELKFLTSN